MSSAGFVLVGGQSRRMGQNKALLPWKTGLLVEFVASAVREAAGSVALIGTPERYSAVPLPAFPDLRPNNGPLGGLETLLRLGSAELNLVCACDMPCVSTGQLRALLQEAQRSEADCLVAVDANDRWHPLCAVYRSSCLPGVERALDEGRLKLLDLVRELKAQPFLMADPVHNVNTIDDWASVAGEVC
jgi:molybdopterin-guanine dinucleotide biosynthesis protein A